MNFPSTSTASLAPGPFNRAIKRVLFRFCPEYDARMDITAFELMKQYLGFMPADARNLIALKNDVEPILPRVTARFYEVIRAQQETRDVFANDAQIERQKRSFIKWLSELFCGDYGIAYFEQRTAIGRTHSDINLPQHFMIGGMDVVWRTFEVQLLQANIPDCLAKIQSLHKLLMLELALMLGTYKESYSQVIRDRERLAVEEKLTRAEHLAQIGQLAASLAHEIKNPLAGISGAIQVIRDGLGSNDSRIPILAEVLTQINRLDSTVKDLLVYARPKPPQMSPCCLNHVLNRVLQVLEEEPTLEKIRIERIRCDEDMEVVADPAQLEQLAFNLLLNAAQASSPGNMIRVDTKRLGRWVKLTIQDFGSGMEPATRDRAFEPFYTTKSKGTGLGLPICKKIIDANGGHIRLESIVNKGSKVIVELPAYIAEPKGADSC
jgi:signal transduction histidine kinase